MAQPTRLQRRFKSHDQGPKGWYREKLLGAFADFEGDGTEAGLAAAGFDVLDWVCFMPAYFTWLISLENWLAARWPRLRGPVIRLLRLPGLRLLLTHSTATGRAEGLKLLRPDDRQVWLPWDTPGAVKRFLGRYRPRLGVLMETELWPNLAAEAAVAHVPLFLVNGRLSERSARGYERVGSLVRPLLHSLAGVAAQTQADAENFSLRWSGWGDPWEQF